MKIRVTSVTDSSVGEKINSITTVMEDRLASEFGPRSYGGGIEQVTVFFISVGNSLENKPFFQMHNRSGRYKNIVTGKMVKYIGVAVSVDTDLVLQSGEKDLWAFLVDMLLQRLREAMHEWPKSFQSQLFVEHTTTVLV